MKKNIKYFSFYNKNFEDRAGAVAAVSKIDFIVGVLKDSGYWVNIISPSWTTQQRQFYKKSEFYLYENHDVLFSPTFSISSKIRTLLSIVISLFWTFFYCLKNVKKDEKILLYHTPWLVIPIFLAKKIKKFKVILEVEEVYSDVKKMNPLIRKIEFYAFKNADIFIFSNNLLAEKLSISKPNIVLYGNYEVYEKRAEQYNDGKIHLLYAGIVDFDKRGAFNALEAAKFLSEKYILHIIGPGSTQELEKQISLHNKTENCKILYDGIKTGDDYIQYAQKCHIGLSTQKMEGDYLDTSFPSKIINYLGLGLNVVSGNIKCVDVSTIRPLINLYYIDTPESIAKSITEVSFMAADDIREQLYSMKGIFSKELINILK